MRALTTRLFVLISISWVLASCASTKDAVLPDDGPSMKAIYDAHFEGMNGASNDAARAAIGSRRSGDGSALEGYARDSTNELDAHFPRLTNPTLVMYVFPHLAGPSRVPIPGYSTTFPMYERTEYALPAKVPVHAVTNPATSETLP